MMSEKWIAWEGTPDIKIFEERYFIGPIFDDSKKFQLTLRAANRSYKIYITLENSVRAYRATDETYRLQTIGAWDGTLNKGKFEGRELWPFFIIENSLYIAWYREQLQKYDAPNNENLKHFAFIDDTTIFDIITTTEPEIQFLPCI